MRSPDKGEGGVRLTVSMPYWRSRDTVRRAVDSILSQTYQDFRLIVVNDGGDSEEWGPLEDIDDQRLVRFDLRANRGRYYADAVTLGACDTEWWTPHDSDDESVPHRFERLLSAAEDDTVAVFGAAKTLKRNGEWGMNRVKPEKRPKPNSLRHFAKYPAAVYRTDTARLVGGPHPELRASYDTSFMCLFWAKYESKLKVIQEPLYLVYKRNGSLTTSKKTGTKVKGGGPSAWRSQQRQKARTLYYQAVKQPSLSAMRKVLRPRLPVAKGLQEDIERLRSLL